MTLLCLVLNIAVLGSFVHSALAFHSVLFRKTMFLLLSTHHVTYSDYDNTTNNNDHNSHLLGVGAPPNVDLTHWPCDLADLGFYTFYME